MSVNSPVSAGSPAAHDENATYRPLPEIAGRPALPIGAGWHGADGGSACATVVVPVVRSRTQILVFLPNTTFLPLSLMSPLTTLPGTSLPLGSSETCLVVPLRRSRT